jgi:hypothetical protein
VQVTAATLLAWVRRHTTAVSWSPLWPGSSFTPPVVSSECYVAALGGVDISASSACFFEAARPLAMAGLFALADATQTCGAESVSSFVTCTLPAVWSAATVEWVSDALQLLSHVVVDKPSGSSASSSTINVAAAAVSAVFKAPAYFASSLSLSGALDDSNLFVLQNILDQLQVSTLGFELTSVTLGTSVIGSASFNTYTSSVSDLDWATWSEGFSSQSSNAGSAWTALRRVACAALTTKSCADRLVKRGGSDTAGIPSPTSSSSSSGVACGSVAAQMPPLRAVGQIFVQSSGYATASTPVSLDLGAMIDSADAIVSRALLAVFPSWAVGRPDLSRPLTDFVYFTVVAFDVEPFTCYPCQGPGVVAASDNSACVCAPGLVISGGSALAPTCAACSGAFQVASADQLRCLCAPGYSSSGSSTSPTCTACAANTYSSAGSDACVPCPSGTTSSPGSATCATSSGVPVLPVASASVAPLASTTQVAAAVQLTGATLGDFASAAAVKTLTTALVSAINSAASIDQASSTLEVLVTSIVDSATATVIYQTAPASGSPSRRRRLSGPVSVIVRYTALLPAALSAKASAVSAAVAPSGSSTFGSSLQTAIVTASGGTLSLTAVALAGPITPTPSASSGPAAPATSAAQAPSVLGAAVGGAVGGALAVVLAIAAFRFFKRPIGVGSSKSPGAPSDEPSAAQRRASLTLRAPGQIGAK